MKSKKSIPRIQRKGELRKIILHNVSHRITHDPLVWFKPDGDWDIYPPTDTRLNDVRRCYSIKGLASSSENKGDTKKILLRNITKNFQKIEKKLRNIKGGIK